MDVKGALFYIFSAILLYAAFRVVTARNPMYAVLYLVLAFTQASMVWMLLKAEFLSIALVLVYVGAVMVLFLFVVMMLDINLDALRRGFWRHFPLAATIGALVALEMAGVLMGGFRGGELSRVTVTLGKTGAPVSNTRELGILLFSQYLYPLEIASVILLVAIIAAIALTMRRRKDAKYMSSSVQVRVHPVDRVRVLQMPVTKPAAPIEPAAESVAAAQPEKKP
ncbi:MAG: NADH-quinone oxidoreductase subunit J [Proteobacteria bacterium]|nr:NADH-quinone oxidoreductase subunit J [Pseudomonadota bacterium]